MHTGILVESILSTRRAEPFWLPCIRLTGQPMPMDAARPSNRTAGRTTTSRTMGH